VPFEVRIGVAPFLHHDLDESTGLGRLLPWRGALAGRETHDDVADAALLAGLELDVTRDVVALVEQAEHRDPLGHRRADAARRGDGRGGAQLLGNVGRFGFLLRRLVVAGGKQDEHGCGRKQSHASGVHAS